MRRTLSAILLFIVFILLITGCAVTTNPDGSKSYNVKPEIIEKVEDVGEVAVGLSPLLGSAGLVVAGAVGTGLTVLKKMQPKLTEAQTKYEVSNTVAAISVEAIEQLKKDHPQLWESMAEKLKKECEECGIDTKVIKNVIRGLRGLPPKV